MKIGWKERDRGTKEARSKRRKASREKRKKVRKEAKIGKVRRGEREREQEKGYVKRRISSEE